MTSDNQTADPNAEAIEAWNTVLFEKFTRYQHLLNEGLGRHGDQLFRRHPASVGARVLDVGCGMGDTTVRLGAMVGAQGEAVGVDCAENFLVAARDHARAHGQTNVRFIRRDVQLDPLEGPYDAAYARFGTMFFNSPVAALRNIRKALQPNGTLHMSVWRKRQDNPCFYIAQQVVERFIAPEDKATDEVTCGPGPFSMAGPDMVSDQLLAAGFSEPDFLRFDAPVCIGRTLDEALAFARDLGPAGESIRLAATKAGRLSAEIEAALREALTPHLREDGVWAMSSTWLISARNPA